MEVECWRWQVGVFQDRLVLPIFGDMNVPFFLAQSNSRSVSLTSSRLSFSIAAHLCNTSFLSIIRKFSFFFFPVHPPVVLTTTVILGGVRILSFFFFLLFVIQHLISHVVDVVLKEENSLPPKKATLHVKTKLRYFRHLHDVRTTCELCILPPEQWTRGIEICWHHGGAQLGSIYNSHSTLYSGVFFTFFLCFLWAKRRRFSKRCEDFHDSFQQSSTSILMRICC